jgi:hypothetical protein
MQSTADDGFLRFWLDPERGTMYISLSTCLDPPRSIQSQGIQGKQHHSSASSTSCWDSLDTLQKLLLLNDCRQQLGLLLLFLSSDVVILLHRGLDLDSLWLNRLRICHKLKEQLSAPKAKQMLHAPSPKAEALLQVIGNRDPPLLFMVGQASL